MTNYAAPQNNGHSIAFDGVAYDANETPLDMKVIEAGRGGRMGKQGKFFHLGSCWS